MNNNDDNDSRINKFEKRRKTTKSITILLLLGSVLIIVLLFMWIFGGNDKESNDPEGASSEIQRDENDSGDKKGEEDTGELDDEDELDKEEDKSKDEDEDKDEDEVKTEQVEPSDDNVTEAYTGDWKAIGTEQSGPHTTNYDEGSQDRIEMEKAIQSATGLSDMTPLWIGNGGDQKVVATVSSPDQLDIYRVYLSWIDGEGWKPTKVEELKESDV